MAYTIISQNNSTTTLSDGVNTITVPSRVNLTSGNFTIVEVNNNMATLEDGDGNVYRDIPCVAVLVGGEGGGGSGLPDQTGQSGKFLTTDGSSASWSDKPLVNNDTHTGSVSISSNTSGSYNTVLGRGSSSYGGNYNTVVGSTSQARNASVAIGVGIQDSTSQNAVIIRSGTQNMGSYVTGITDSFTWIKGTTQYELVSGDGTIPEARLADTTNAQQGDVLTLDANGDAVWQAGGGGLPSQTGNAGKFLTTDGTDASWSDKPLVNKATGFESLAIGSGYTGSTGTQSVAIGPSVTAGGFYGIGIGNYVGAGSGIAIGRNIFIGSSGYDSIVFGKTGSTYTNNDPHTFKIVNENGNFEIMSADGTIPTARLTKVNSTITLTSAGWSGGSQTVTVSGMTATGVVLVSPDPTDQADYTSAGILCTAQAADSLTFTCSTTPSADIDVNVVML